MFNSKLWKFWICKCTIHDIFSCAVVVPRFWSFQIVQSQYRYRCVIFSQKMTGSGLLSDWQVTVNAVWLYSRTDGESLYELCDPCPYLISNKESNVGGKYRVNTDSRGLGYISMEI
jgi:hypothetical protein